MLFGNYLKVFRFDWNGTLAVSNVFEDSNPWIGKLSVTQSSKIQGDVIGKKNLFFLDKTAELFEFRQPTSYPMVRSIKQIYSS